MAPAKAYSLVQVLELSRTT